MPLLKGKENIGRNIATEERHGKPRDQAVAIAMNVAGESNHKSALEKIEKSLGMNETSGADGGFLVKPEHKTADGQALSTKSLISEDDTGARTPPCRASEEDLDSHEPKLAVAPTGAMAPGPETSALIHEPPPAEVTHPYGGNAIPLERIQLMERMRVQQLLHADGLMAAHRARHAQVKATLMKQAR